MRKGIGLAFGVALMGLVGGEAGATIPYGTTGTPAPGVPGFGKSVTPPTMVPGKEYSHDMDYEITAVGTAADPEQIVNWDGFGGVANGIDYSMTRLSWTVDQDIDAIANRRDYAFQQLKADEAHLLFSLDDAFVGYTFGSPFAGTIPPGTPPGVVLGNGNLVGGSGEVNYELATAGAAAGNPFDMQGLWAAQADVNGMPLPGDVDGLEVWGPEPTPGGMSLGDADKYSLDVDILNFGATVGGDAVSVWNGSGTPYVMHSAVTAAVTSLLGPLPSHLDAAINLDALMVYDVISQGGEDVFDFVPDRGGVGSGEAFPMADEIIFSIRQIPDPLDTDGYYATGSELFVMSADPLTPAVYLAHGGHLWDHAYTLAAFEVFKQDPNNYAVLDINAIEAVGQDVVPEPASAVMLLLGAGAMMTRRRRS